MLWYAELYAEQGGDRGRTLNQQKYTSNPGFLGFMNSTGLPFKSYDEFKRAAYNKKCQMLGRLRVERGLAGFSLFDDF